MPRSSQKPRQASSPPETVEGAWLLKAFSVVVVTALLCTYATLCILFSKSQWQLILHPVRASKGAAAGSLIRFGAGDTGQPELTGEWLPASTTNSHNRLTILFLASGDGTRRDFAATQSGLRSLGLNVFTFDYRGYGDSANLHPSEQRMLKDSETAWQYLTGTREISETTIIPYGVGVGASLATTLAVEHREVPALILDTPYCDLRESFRRNPRFRFLPVRLLFHEDFALKTPLSTLAKPKLLISRDRSSESGAYSSAAEPKILVSLPSSSGPQFEEATNRFLDRYLAVPSPAPAVTKVP